MDVLTLFLLVAGAQGLLLSLGLISRFRSNKSAFFFGLIVFVISIEIMNSFAMHTGYHTSEWGFPFWNLGSYWVTPAALLLYIRLNLERGFTVTKKDALFFLPAVIHIVLLFSLDITWLSKSTPWFNIAWFTFSELLPVLAMLGVVVIYGIKFQQTKKQYDSPKLAGIESFFYKHLGIFVTFSCITILWVVLILSDLGIISTAWYSPGFDAVEGLLITLIFGIGYFCFFDPDFFEIPKSFDRTCKNHQDFSAYDNATELKRIHTLLTKEKVYSDRKLTLSRFSRMLNLPSRYVSYLVNTYHGTNFQDFINQFRVEEVIRKMGDSSQRHKTIIALAEESGFNSKSTFNEVFKSKTGKTPSQYFKVLDK